MRSHRTLEQSAPGTPRQARTARLPRGRYRPLALPLRGGSHAASCRSTAPPCRRNCPSIARFWARTGDRAGWPCGVGAFRSPCGVVAGVPVEMGEMVLIPETVIGISISLLMDGVRIKMVYKTEHSCVERKVHELG